MPHVYDGIHLPGVEPPACEQQGIRHISEQEVRAMAGQEGLVLQGCGGDLKEWVDGINGLLTEEVESCETARYSRKPMLSPTMA